jgi:hypothetical protein
VLVVVLVEVELEVEVVVVDEEVLVEVVEVKSLPVCSKPRAMAIPPISPNRAFCAKRKLFSLA